MMETYSYKEYFKDLYNALPGSKLWFGLIWMLRLVSGLGKLASLYIVGLVVDFFTKYNQGDSLLPLIGMVAAMIVIEILAVVLRIYSKSQLQQVGLKMQQTYRMNALKKLLALDLSWHEETNTGSKMNNISKGSASLEGFMNLLSNDLSGILSGTIAVLAIFLFISWKYLAFIVLFAIGFFILERYFAKKIYDAVKALFIREEKLAGKTHEISNNILSVKSLGLHNKLKQKVTTQEKDYKEKWLQRKKTSFSKLKIINSTIAIGHGLFLLLVGFDVLAGTLSVGMMIVYISYYTRFAGEISRYSHIELQLINYKTRFARLKKILDEKETNIDPIQGTTIEKNWKEILFNKVSFSYKNNKVLKDFSLRIKRNEKIGIVGLSGSGKSTLMKLFLRLYKPQQGNIYIGRKNLFSVARNALRKKVTVVLQDQELFNLSLKENIMLAGKQKNETAFKEVIQKSGLENVIKKLPQKEKTLIGEKGYKLSGGERQRLGIARAIYRNADILILDEATSSLDSKTEEHIQESIDQLEDKTILIIAHRLATLQNVDKILFMEKGKIVESGNFKELLKKQGKFYELWKRQELTK